MQGLTDAYMDGNIAMANALTHNGNTLAAVLFAVFGGSGQAPQAPLLPLRTAAPPPPPKKPQAGHPGPSAL